MKIRFHIGTEKTGSSFIQSSWALNRDFLERNEVYFPTAGRRESDMINGRISPGNAKPLYLSMMKRDKSEMRKVLSQWINEAKKKNCTTLLLSNENLMESFGEAARMQLLLEVVKELGADFQSALLFLRDPVGQAISLYKHRGRKGRVSPLTEWMEKGYVLPDNLSHLRNTIDRIGLPVELRKYQKDSKFLEQVIYKEWLGIEIPDKRIDKQVNPSLTLDEIELVRQLWSKDPQLVHELYDQLLAIPMVKKAKNSLLNEYYGMKLGNHIARSNKVWIDYNDRLPDNEKLKIPEIVSDVNTEDSISFNFSKHQLQVVSQYIHLASTGGFKWRIMWRRIRTKVSLFRVKMRKNA